MKTYVLNKEGGGAYRETLCPTAQKSFHGPFTKKEKKQASWKHMPYVFPEPVKQMNVLQNVS